MERGGGFGKEDWGAVPCEGKSATELQELHLSQHSSSLDHVMSIECFLRVRVSCTGSASCRHTGGILCSGLVDRKQAHIFPLTTLFNAGDFSPRTHPSASGLTLHLFRPWRIRATNVSKKRPLGRGIIVRSCIMLSHYTHMYVTQPAFIGNKSVGATWVGCRSLLYICSIIRGNQVRGTKKTRRTQFL